jgi:hypothetical protein
MITGFNDSFIVVVPCILKSLSWKSKVELHCCYNRFGNDGCLGYTSFQTGGLINKR